MDFFEKIVLIAKRAIIKKLTWK